MTEKALHGVNLSGWLVLESWVTPELFAATGALDEASLKRALGHARYAAVVRHHRRTFVTERDFAQVAARGLNAVRIPVPWYVLGDGGPDPGDNVGCLPCLDDAFDWAEAAGVGVLLDLALAPGATPGPDGMEMRLDPSAAHRSATLDVIAALAQRYAPREALLGIEPLDEPAPRRRRGLSVTEGVPLSHLRNFYRDAYDVVREVAGERPVVVLSDAGMPGAWRRFMAQERYRNVWLDCHLYHNVDQVDASGPSGARYLVGKSRRSLERARESGLPACVGAWSSALPFADSSMTPEGRMALERVYTSGQLAAFEACPAWFFQTWKTSGRLSAWDARVALSSFERGMLD